MPDSTSNIENILHAIERKPFAYQLKKVEIPPIVARVAEYSAEWESRVRNSLAILHVPLAGLS